MKVMNTSRKAVFRCFMDLDSWSGTGQEGGSSCGEKCRCGGGNSVAEVADEDRVVKDVNHVIPIKVGATTCGWLTGAAELIDN